jgi:hypothetical protein
VKRRPSNDLTDFLNIAEAPDWVWEEYQRLRNKLATVTAERDALLGMLSCLKHHHMTKAGISRLVRNTEAAIDAAKGGGK